MREIGQALKERRLARGFEIGDVAKLTCISAHYIKTMEEGKFQLIPNVFDKGYLKIYARLLDLDARRLVELYERKKKEWEVHRIAHSQSA